MLSYMNSKADRGLAAHCIGLLLACAVCGLPGAVAAPPVDAELVSAARQTAQTLGARLKSQLTAAIAAGGPAAALAVCNTTAPAIAGDLAASYGGEVGRTALRVRNAANAPDAYERAVLEDFAARVAAGEDPATLEHAAVVEEDGQRRLRYLKAIPMAEAPCASCHGMAIAPDLAARIRALYPADAATGFVPGELRGAFSLSKSLPPAQQP